MEMIRLEEEQRWEGGRIGKEQPISEKELIKCTSIISGGRKSPLPESIEPVDES